ncbi:hypothetical protein LP414_20225 [Polaromonas sp. P1(28)-13]|nr:hypothetical protein LP414_20225 [Polaromonas sp. P1(28)-13]
MDRGGDKPATAEGATFRVTADLAGLALRVNAVYKDANGVLENAFSAPTAPVIDVVTPPPVAAAALPDGSLVSSRGVHLIHSDLQFILDQIVIVERDAAGENLLDLIPNSRVAFGLRTVDGSFNNLVQGQTEFGASDNVFPRMTDPVFRPGYEATTGLVTDPQPRIISNLIVDQTITNPAAVEAFVAAGQGTRAVDALGNPTFNPDGTPIILDLNGVAIPRGQTLTIPNVAPDEGLSASFNAWFTFFGQFFDHGLDLVQRAAAARSSSRSNRTIRSSRMVLTGLPVPAMS